MDVEKPAILVVDDEAVITTQISEVLDSYGYHVAGVASSGDEAVGLAERLKPDLVLMDIVMPGKMNGIEAGDMIQKSMDIPVVFVTVHADEQNISRAKKVNPYGFIIKPYLEGQIRAAVEVALQNKKYESQLSKLIFECKNNIKSQELKLQETHHRIKNHLNMIYNFINLQKMNMDNNLCSDILKDLSSRIFNVARIHEKLNWNYETTSINCAEYIQNIIELLRDSFVYKDMINFNIDLDDLELPSDETISLGIIINELVFNCLNHAFPESIPGHITVRLKNLDTRFELSVSDTGVGITKALAPQDSAQGLGVVHALTIMLDGSLNITGSRGGTTVVMTFPLQNLEC